MGLGIKKYRINEHNNFFLLNRDHIIASFSRPPDSVVTAWFPKQNAKCQFAHVTWNHSHQLTRIQKQRCGHVLIQAARCPCMLRRGKKNDCLLVLHNFFSKGSVGRSFFLLIFSPSFSHKISVSRPGKLF